MELPVVNHPDYVAKINDDNKFPIQKFGALAEHLLKAGVVKKFHIPKECSTETMKTSHSLKYINHIRNKTLDIKLQKKIGFPINDSVVRRSFVATGGTVLASKLALDSKLACNTAGGSHHATFEYGAGYCVFNDVAVAANYLKDRGYAKKILILDLDVRTGLSRAKSRGALDRFEKEKLDFFERVRRTYLSIAASATNRCVVIDADNEREAISKEIRDLLSEKFLG